MSEQFELIAELRESIGTGSSRRLRHAGRVPAVVYGAHKDNVNITLQHNELSRHLGTEAFHSAVIKLKVGGKSEQVILRDVQMHPFKTQIAHLDFQRISAKEKLHIKVPLHFIGEDVAPGIKEGGLVSHLITEVDVACLPKDLPEFLEIDLSATELNQTESLSAIRLPEGVEITSLAHGNEDLAVAAISLPKASALDEEDSEDEEIEDSEDSEESEESEE